MQIVPRLQTTKVQKMIKKYRKFQYNLTMRGIVYTFLYKNKKNFFIFFKPWYNWYNLKKIVIPTLIRSFLYQKGLVQSGTIGTIAKNLVIPTIQGTRAHDSINKFINYKTWSIHNHAQK
jgi:hypothetical protein